jgi:hypothetical protein
MSFGHSEGFQIAMLVKEHENLPSKQAAHSRTHLECCTAFYPVSSVASYHKTERATVLNVQVENAGLKIRRIAVKARTCIHTKLATVAPGEELVRND